MKKNIKWIVSGLLLLLSFGTTFIRSPEAVTLMLEEVAADLRAYSAVIHHVFIVVIVAGLFAEKLRKLLFPAFIACLSLSATIIAVRYRILPNIIVFGLFLVWIIRAYTVGRLNFDFHRMTPVNIIFGVIGLVFGFWYPHWVESPIIINAMLYSPLGGVNCPTMATICGFLCLTSPPRSAILEATVALATLYFGFFGLFKLNAYIDVILIICALFLILRLGAGLTLTGVFVKTSVKTVNQEIDPQ